LEQRQLAKAQALQQQRLAWEQSDIVAQELSRQQDFALRQALSQRQPGLSAERSATFQEGLLRQDLEAKRRCDQALESGLLRNQNLLEQQLALPRADLLDDQKALTLRLKKDQQGQ